MSLRTLEAAILRELKKVAKNKTLKQRDIMEWRTGADCPIRSGEIRSLLPELNVSVAVKVDQAALDAGDEE